MPLIPCTFAFLGESLLGANGVYIANYNMKCVFFLRLLILPCKLRHILAVRSAPNRVAGESPSRRRRAAIAAMPPYYAGLQSGVCSGRTPVRGQWRLYSELQYEMRVFFATSTLPCKFRGSTALMPFVSCRFAVRGLFRATPC